MRTVLDLRLLPAAVTAWASTLLVLRGRAAVPVGVVSVVMLLVVAGVAWARRHRVRAEDTTASGDASTHRGANACTRAIRTGTGQVLLVCATGLAAALSTGGQLEARDRSPLLELAERGASVRLVGRVATPVTARGEELHRGEVSALSVATGSEASGGRPAAASGRVLVLGGEEWAARGLGEELILDGRLSPARLGGRAVAVLRPTAVQAVSRADPVARQVERSRRALREVAARLSGDAASLVPGIAVGDTSLVGSRLEESMRRSGLTHVMAVSGAHFAIVGAVVLALCARARWPPWVLATVLAVVSAAFVALVRPEPSVVRAGVMAVVGLTGLVLGRRARAPAALAATVIAVLLADPWLAASPGFALSVLATAGLLGLSGPVARVCATAMPRWLAWGLAAPFSAQLACAPLLVTMEPVLGVYAVPANLAVLPAVPPATVLGLLAAASGGWAPGLSEGLTRAACLFTGWIAGVAHTAAGLPLAVVPWRPGWSGAVLLALLSWSLVIALLRLYGDRGPLREGLDVPWPGPR